MKKIYFSRKSAFSVSLTPVFLFCLTFVLPAKAQDDFSLLSPAAISYSNSSSASFPAPTALARVSVADFDSDGDADILYQTGADGTAFRYARSNGNGTFTDLAQSASPFAGVTLPDLSNRNFYPADYDGDRDIDLWSAANASTGTYFRNDGSAFSSQSSASFPAPSFYARVAVADFDTDGDADILYQTGASGSTFRYSRSNGDGTFTDLAQADSPFASVTLPDNGSRNFYPADYDGDRDIDFWSAANASTGSYFRNDGSAFSSQSTSTFPAPTALARVAPADFDSDGDADILYQTGASGTPFRYARSSGNGTFTDLAQADSPFAGVTLPDNGNRNYNTADYDGDGDVDLWSAANGTTGSYFMQNDRPPFIASSNPADNAVNVPTGANISITFNETVTKGTGNIRIVRVSDNTVVETIAVTSAQVTGANTNYAINPLMNLASNTAYAVRFDAGTFRDADGAIFPGIGNNTQLNFTTLPPTAAAVILTGRVLTASKRGIANVSVILSNFGGETRIARTNPFGYYRFDDLEIGTYVVTFQSRRFGFAPNPQVLTILEEVESYDFVAVPF